MRTGEQIQEIINQIRDGVEAAKAEGVYCGYPDCVVIDGVQFPFIPTAHTPSERP